MLKKSVILLRAGGLEAGEATEYTNVAGPERWASVLGGSILAIFGLSRRSLGGLALAAVGVPLIYRGASGHCPAYSAMGLSTAGAKGRQEAVRIARSVTVRRPRSELYAFWRQLENLPRFMRHLESVRTLDEKRSAWQVRVPRELTDIVWEAEIVEDRPDELIAWRSLPGSEIENAGIVRFREAPGGDTEVQVEIEYRPPAGVIGQAAARLLNPVFSQMVKEDVRRFKNLLETGEIPTTEGQPAGR